MITLNLFIISLPIIGSQETTKKRKSCCKFCIIIVTRAGHDCGGAGRVILSIPPTPSDTIGLELRTQLIN